MSWWIILLPSRRQDFSLTKHCHIHYREDETMHFGTPRHHFVLHLLQTLEASELNSYYMNQTLLFLLKVFYSFPIISQRKNPHNFPFDKKKNLKVLSPICWVRLFWVNSSKEIIIPCFFNVIVKLLIPKVVGWNFEN